MQENENNNSNDYNSNAESNQEIPISNSSNFKTVKNTETYSTYANKKKGNKSKQPGGLKNIFVPFLSGVLGGALVIGTCLGVPSIKEELFEISSDDSDSSNYSSTTTSNGYVDQVSLTTYSDTAVYAANKILPSIVGIEVTYTISSSSTMFGSSSGASSTATATGSGIIISEDGYILTNNHIVSSSSTDSYYSVSEASSVTVTLFDDETIYDATIIGMDEETDLAVIKIEATDLVVAEFADSDSIKVGEFAMAVGNPLGMDSTITCGVVSALNREVTDENGNTYTLIQTDAAINSGNSGGALVNSEGQVIGINSLKISGDGVEGMGFAIPINSTLDIIDDLIEYNKVRRPYIGISGVDLDEETAEAYNLTVGIYVKSIEDFSAGELAGLKVGDVIIAADGTDITTMDELNEIKNTHDIGDEMEVTVIRNDSEKTLTITLGEQP